MAGGKAVSASTQAPPDDLRLKAGPQPVTRINRRLLILIAAIGLAGIALLVLIALQPSSWRNAAPPEQVTVETRPVTDRLSELPPSYDAAGSPLKPAPGSALCPKPEVPPLGNPAGVEGDVLKSPVFFRLQLKQPANKADITPQSSTGLSSPSGGIAAYDPVSAARRAADRAQALAAGDVAPPDTGAASQDRKLSFLKQDSAREIYNPHQLEQPVSPYQLLAGSIIPASLLSGLNSDLPGFRDRPDHRAGLRQRHRTPSADPARVAPHRPL
jgi:type IV secretion system protein VirB10